MYLVEAFNKENMGSDSRFWQQCQMFGIPLTLVEQADRVEVWGTSFKDSGSDYCEFRFIKSARVFDTRRVGGY